MQLNIFANLQNIPLFAGVPDDILESLALKTRVSKFPKHATIITEGDDSTSMYILLSGKVRVFTSYEEGKEITLLVQEAGSYFGELALLTCEPRSASVVTMEKTVCGIINQSDFIQWLQSHPEITLTLLTVMSGKIRMLTERVKQLALSNVYERTITHLMRMARQEGELLIIKKMPTQQELANVVGASREMVNKVLKELIKGGYITLQDKTLVFESKPPSSW